MSYLELKDVCKRYEKAEYDSVKNFNIKIKKGEFIAFVGPSGCGKSTTLRMIAGLEEITGGELVLEDEIINNKDPKDRDMAMVFQSYALYPHMTVEENISFGLRLRKIPKFEIERKVKEAADMLGLSEVLTKKPKNLSGGQRQRVALARAIVREPKVFLMDEPLSNLDAKLRASTRIEISKIHKRLNATTVYVTHDQIEAMTMADRIVIMKAGEVQQIGTPLELYNKPVNQFVAGFIGTPQMNFTRVVLEGDKVKLNNNYLNLPAGIVKTLHELGYDGRELVLGVRPEKVFSENFILAQDVANVGKITLDVEISENIGNQILVYSEINGSKFVSSINAREALVEEKITIGIDFNSAHFFDVNTEETVY